MLVTVTANNWRYPYGTMCQVISEHKNKRGYIVAVGEIGSHYYIAKINVREI